MFKIIVDNIYSYIEPQLHPNILIQLDEELKFRPDGYQHTWYYKNKKWDGFNHLFNVIEQKFRTGLLWRISTRLKSLNVDFSIIDVRKKHEIIVHKAKWGNISLHEFQQQAAASTLENTHGVIASPTGTGKTLIISRAVELLKLKTLVIVNSRVLLDQTFDTLDAIFPGQVGIIGSGDFEIDDIVVATIQTLSSTLGIGKKQEPTKNADTLSDWLQDVGLTIFDEVHEADSNSVNGICTKIPAYRFIGTTATPYAWARTSERSKNLEMEQNFGIKIFDSRDSVDFIKLGITVPLCINRMYTPVIEEYANYDSHERTTEEYKDVVQKQVVNNEERTQFIAKKAREIVQDKLSCYIYYNRIAYGESICDALSDLDPIMLQGSTSRNQRKQVFKDVEDKKKLLVVSDIGSYGLNIRSLDSIIIAFPVRDARQIKGRVCRAYPGKTSGLVVDLIDNCPYLKHHSDLRLTQYKKDKNLVVG